MARSTFRPSSRWHALVMVLLVSGAVVLSGCARTIEAPPSAPGQVKDRWPGCVSLGAFTEAFGGPTETGSIPDGFVPAQAVRCQTDQRTSAAGETISVGLERRADDIAPLLAYLARPSTVSTRPETVSCPAVAIPKPWLFLTDEAGRWVAPAVPTDSCDFPLDVFLESGPAYDNLDYRDAAVTQLAVVETAEARKAGCAMEWKNMVQVEASDGESPGAPITADPFGGREVGVCVYDVPESQTTLDSPTGDFRTGRRPDQEDRKGLVTALVGSKAAMSGCTESAKRFAVLQSSQGDVIVYVELDGCRRILVGDGQSSTFAHASPALIQLLSRGL